jgi:hypothetical protein
VHVTVDLGRVGSVALRVEELLELGVVRDLAVALEDRHVAPHLFEGRTGIVGAVRPAHRDLVDADVDHDRPRGLVAELEQEAVVGLG